MSEEGDPQWNLTVVGVVALVTIVSLIAMYLHGRSFSSPVMFASDDSNAAGAAVRMALTTEQVTCLFNASGAHWCASSAGNCTTGAVPSCIVSVSADRGKKLLWVSDCKPSPQETKMDGAPETLRFACSTTSTSELVTCYFNNSRGPQGCTSAYGGCIGNTSCVARVSGASGAIVPWSSTCNGTATTRLDGTAELISFRC